MLFLCTKIHITHFRTDEVYWMLDCLSSFFLTDKCETSGKITMVVYLFWIQEVAGSNPASQTKCGNGGMVYASDLGSGFWEFESLFPYKRSTTGIFFLIFFKKNQSTQIDCVDWLNLCGVNERKRFFKDNSGQKKVTSIIPKFTFLIIWIEIVAQLVEQQQ